jgi:DNA-3-methyladenine glycosylase I
MSRSYCEIAPTHPVHASYHATEYGFPCADEQALFERLSLEIMQAGLSWEIVLKKRAALNTAFHSFQPAKVAAYGAKDVTRLLADADIIRNRLKIGAIIYNAQIILDMRKTHGGFDRWLSFHSPRRKPEWVKLFKKTFKFTGGEITGEFLMSIGYLPGAHWSGCTIYKELASREAQAGS